MDLHDPLLHISCHTHDAENDVMPNNKIEGTVFDLDINDQWVSDCWRGIGEMILMK